MPRPSEDVDPMSLDGVNPRDHVSHEEVLYFKDFYGDRCCASGDVARPVGRGGLRQDGRPSGRSQSVDLKKKAA